MTRRSLTLVLAVPVALALGGALFIDRYLAVDESYTLSVRDQADMLTTVRGHLGVLLGGGKLDPASTAFAWGWLPGRQVWISLYTRAATNTRRLPYWIQGAGEGRTMREAVGAALTLLAADPQFTAVRALPAARRAALLDSMRIKIDVLRDTGRIIALFPRMRDLSFNYGVDGFRVARDGAAAWILPDEVVEAGIRQHAVDQNTFYGIDFPSVDEYLSRKSGRRVAAAGADVARVRTLAFIETGKDRGPAVTYRANLLRDRAAIKGRDLARAVVASGSNLAAAVGKDGRFRYLYYPLTGLAPASEYSWPRHVGATWLLYRLAGACGQNGFRAAAERSFELARQSLALDALPRSLNFNHDLNTLGIAVLALLERRTLTGATNGDALVRGLCAAMLRMQDGRGMFHERIAFGQAPLLREAQPYAPGEAMLALAAAHRVFGDPRYLDAVRRGLTFAVDRLWSFFGSRVQYGFFSWEMMAIEAVRDRWPDPAAAAFCFDQAESLIATQVGAAWPGGRDWAGGFEQSVFNVPKAAHVGARGEGILAAYRLAVAMGKPALAAVFAASLRRGVGFILDQQVREENSWYYRDLGPALGAIRYTPTFHELRIDHTQHCAAVLLEAWKADLFKN